MTSRVIPSDDDGNHTTVIRCMAHELGCVGLQAAVRAARMPSQWPEQNKSRIEVLPDSATCSIARSRSPSDGAVVGKKAPQTNGDTRNSCV